MTDKAPPSIFVDDFRILLGMCRRLDRDITGEEPTLPSSTPKHVVRKIFSHLGETADRCREISKDVEHAARRMFHEGTRLERELAAERAKTQSLTAELARCKTPF